VVRRRLSSRRAATAPTLHWATCPPWDIAKVLETGPLDYGMFGMSYMVSGHTLKHLSAGLGAYWLLHMVKYRRPIPIATRP
jgi:hypothetical protein